MTVAIDKRVSELERKMRLLESEQERMPARVVVAHNKSLPVIRTSKQGDLCIKGSGDDMEVYVCDGKDWVRITLTNYVTAVLASYLTIAAHTAIGDSSPHHAAATVTGELSISGQQIGKKTAATQTLSSGETITHDQAERILITTTSIFTITASTTTPIQNGIRNGQELVIEFVKSGAGTLKIPSSGNADLYGDCSLYQYGAGGPPYPWLKVRWDATAEVWYEVDRKSTSGSINSGMGAIVGPDNNNTGLYSLLVGLGNENSAGYATLVGLHLTNAGARNLLAGYYGSLGSNVEDCLAYGSYYSINEEDVLLVYSPGRISVDGDCQTVAYGVILTITGNNPANTDTLSIPLDEDSTYLVRAEVLAHQAGSADHAKYYKEGLFYRAGSGSAAQEGSTADIVSEIESDAGWDCTLTASGNNAVVTCTGDLSETTYWNLLVTARKIVA